VVDRVLVWSCCLVLKVAFCRRGVPKACPQQHGGNTPVVTAFRFHGCVIWLPGVCVDLYACKSTLFRLLIARALCEFRRTSRNRRYAPAGRLLRGVWPSTMYNDHAL
jgi:hypothetical protein